VSQDSVSTRIPFRDYYKRIESWRVLAVAGAQSCRVAVNPDRDLGREFAALKLRKFRRMLRCRMS
jgi:hypothetical protein